jgi:hypothetical protein
MTQTPEGNPMTPEQVVVELRKLTADCKTNWCKFCANQKAAADLIETLAAERDALAGLVVALQKAAKAGRCSCRKDYKLHCPTCKGALHKRRDGEYYCVSKCNQWKPIFERDLEFTVAQVCLHCTALALSLPEAVVQVQEEK